MNFRFFWNNKQIISFLHVVSSIVSSQLLVSFVTVDAAFGEETSPCGNTNLSSFAGTIRSPNFSLVYPYEIRCEWKIFSPEKSVIKITVVHFNLLEDQPCLRPPCCSNQWLLLPKEGGGESERICGNHSMSKIITLSQPVTSIKYFSSSSNGDRGGFQIAYHINVNNCDKNEFKCGNGKCIRNDFLCNGEDNCGDGTDEVNCATRKHSSQYEFLPRKIQVYEMCGDGKKSCELSPDHCYSPMDVCDGEFDCPNGEDEVGCSSECPNQIACSSGGCYHPTQRCNFRRNCKDNSDETGCPTEPCVALQFTCLNGACVAESALCDGIDDCGDFSDEETCTRSSFMTAAIMGLLSCIFLFCIGLGCLYKVYVARLRESAGFVHQLESEPIDDEFIYREPPPAYSVAVRDSRVISYPFPDSNERYFEPETPVYHPRNSRLNVDRHRCDRSSRSCPRPSSTLAGFEDGDMSHFPDVSPQLKQCNCNKPTLSTNVEGVVELLRFPETTIQSQENVTSDACNKQSSCSSPSLSHSRESITSSTSLEGQEEKVESFES